MRPQEIGLAIKVQNAVRSTRPRVLIAEDSLVIALDLENIVLQAGCEIVEKTSDIQRSISVIESEDIDFAIIDYRLSDGTIEEVVDKLRERRIPFAICTGDERKRIRSDFPDALVISKPFDTDDVKTMLIALKSAGGAAVSN
jgi:two-component system, response regulator PdtaR